MKRKWSLLLVFLFVALMIAGLAMGEFRSVLEKAITICLDCIGIG
jgi:hypothetical protein